MLHGSGKSSENRKGLVCFITRLTSGRCEVNIVGGMYTRFSRSWISSCSVVPRSTPFFCSSVCVDNNTLKRKEQQKWRAWYASSYDCYQVDVRWMCWGHVYSALQVLDQFMQRNSSYRTYPHQYPQFTDLTGQQRTFWSWNKPLIVHLC